jgi:hypothetical protein
MSSLSRLVLLCLVFIGLAGCGGCHELVPSEPLKMWAIEFGTGVDAENKITSPTKTFTPQSTVYASIETRGAGQGTLVVEWAANSTIVDGVKQAYTTIVDTQTQEINTTQPAHFAFHCIPPDGWPKGKNRVRFRLDGTADTDKHVAEFEVE